MSFEKMREAIINELRQKIYRDLDLAFKQKVHPVVEYTGTVKHITIDFAEVLKHYSRNQLKCVYCGAPLGIPQQGDTVVCQYCGQTNRAVDVLKFLEKLEGKQGAQEQSTPQPQAYEGTLSQSPPAPQSQPAYQQPPASGAPPPQPTAPAMAPCPYCGAQNPATAAFCQKCGGKLR